MWGRKKQFGGGKTCLRDELKLIRGGAEAVVTLLLRQIASTQSLREKGEGDGKGGRGVGYLGPCSGKEEATREGSDQRHDLGGEKGHVAEGKSNPRTN